MCCDDRLKPHPKADIRNVAIFVIFTGTVSDLKMKHTVNLAGISKMTEA